MSLVHYSRSPLSLVALGALSQGDVTRTGRTTLLCTLRRGADEEQTQEKGPDPDMTKEEPLITNCALASLDRGTQSSTKRLRSGGQHSLRLGGPRACVGILDPTTLLFTLPKPHFLLFIVGSELALSSQGDVSNKGEDACGLGALVCASSSVTQRHLHTVISRNPDLTATQALQMWLWPFSHGSWNEVIGISQKIPSALGFEQSLVCTSLPEDPVGFASVCFQLHILSSNSQNTPTTTFQRCQ